MIDPIAMTSLAELSGNVGFGLVTIGAGLGIGLIGAKAAEATGRNPGASSPIMVIAITLAARLYGNIYAGETIIDTMAHMFGPVLSALCVLPFLAIELLVGFIQALVFLLLTAIFLKLQVGDDDAHGHTSKNEEKELPVPDSPPPGKAS